MKDEPSASTQDDNIETKTDSKKRIGSILRRWCRSLTSLLVVLLVGGSLSGHHRYFDLLSHFQVQYFISALLLSVVLFAAGSRKWGFIASICLIWTGIHVVPWYVPPAPIQGEGNLRLMLVNVLQTNNRYQDVLGQIEREDPDIVILQEINLAWLEQLESLGRERPHWIHVPGGVLRGMAIFSRLPLGDVHSEEFGDRMTPSVIATLEVEGTAVSLVASHPWPPSSAFDYRARNAQLAEVGAYVARQPDPRILIGDLNLTMWSAHYRKLEDTTDLKNVRSGFGVLPSFPMDDLIFLRVPIDHCLVSEDISVVDCRLGEPNGSDHAPLIVDLLIRPD